MLRALGSSVLLPLPPLSFFNQMACSGVDRIKTAAAAAADDCVVLESPRTHAHMHSHVRTKHWNLQQQACTHTHSVQAIQHRQSVVIYTCMHIQRPQHMHELVHMHAHTAKAYTFIQAKMHVTHLNVVFLSLSFASTNSQRLSLNTVSFWTAAVICHVSLCHVI